ncbi:MAG: DUF1254 domain-containing protein [Gammaproteobacteria bacterium]|nr:DUF1254 domain-containing protein [Gammaproteobacteria bacterium]MBK9664995.1 DUF1254 domain-containing protein [Gammaproteobacteria bacterium]
MNFRLASGVLACLLGFTASLASASDGPAPERVRELARAAYIWGYPMVDLYSILHSQTLDPSSAEFKAPLNHVGHVRHVGTPQDKVVVAPNLDTPYSYAWLDLRAEPVVITVPPFESNRYLSLQISDLYTWIVGYVTPRTNGYGGGDFLVAREAWQGEAPPGIRKVFRSPTDLALGFFRIQLLNPDDLPNVHRLQNSIVVRPLSTYMGDPNAPAPQPMPAPITAINVRKTPTDPAFFDILNWMLQFMPVLPEEVELRRDIAGTGIGAGQRFRPDDGPRATVIAGMEEGHAEIQQRAAKVRSSAEIFGSREFIGRDYLSRAAGAMLGILGNSAEEFLGIGYPADAEGNPFDGNKRYRIHFEPDRMPPVGAFWSITVYTQERLLYANPLQRYAINSPLVPTLVRDADDGFTIDIQHESPGPERESNWLPVPQAPFILTFRAYQPEDAIREGTWKAPPPVPLPLPH